jgi:hypothetical protein
MKIQMDWQSRYARYKQRNNAETGEPELTFQQFQQRERHAWRQHHANRIANKLPNKKPRKPLPSPTTS